MEKDVFAFDHTHQSIFNMDSPYIFILWVYTALPGILVIQLLYTS